MLTVTCPGKKKGNIMNFNTVYNACMSKMASMKKEGMYKRADRTDGSQSAQIGTIREGNVYAAQLARNAQAHREQLVQQAATDPKRPGISPAERATDMEIILDRPLRYGSDRFVNDWRLMRTAPTGSVITQAQLDAHRNRQAGYQADMLFDSDTNQFDAAQQYLIERGRENQRRYNNGILWKNEPTKVPMPEVISNPEDVTALDHAGYSMANNNRNRNPNTGYA